MATGLLIEQRGGNAEALINLLFGATVIMLSGLLASFPMMLMPVNWVVELVVAVFEVVFFSWFQYLARHTK